MRSLIITVILLFSLVVTPKYAFTDEDPFEIADYLLAPTFNTGVLGVFGGYMGGSGVWNDVPTAMDWSIGNTVPFSPTRTDDMVFSTTIGSWLSPPEWRERMRITKDGKVGIGTTSPNEQLEITGNFRLPASTETVGVIKSDGNRFIHNFGTNNFFAGVNAGNLSTSGSGKNTGVGVNALQSITTGIENTAIGQDALNINATGSRNTAVGRSALRDNTSSENTAVGQEALLKSTTGTNNTAVGADAIRENDSGSNNTAVGKDAIKNNDSGSNNTAMGDSALVSNTVGNQNTAIGKDALSSNVAGFQNTAIGTFADVIGGANSTAIGYAAIVNGSNKIRLGNALVTIVESAGTFRSTNATNGLLVDGNVGIGTTSFDGTAAGVLAIANGTAPATGTANQAYIYAKNVSASSEMHVMDEAGNETQISPHDPVTGEWIFYSKNTKTGRVVRVNMEKLVKKIEELTGEIFMEEWIEQ